MMSLQFSFDIWRDRRYIPLLLFESVGIFPSTSLAVKQTKTGKYYKFYYLFINLWKGSITNISIWYVDFQFTYVWMDLKQIITHPLSKYTDKGWGSYKKRMLVCWYGSKMRKSLFLRRVAGGGRYFTKTCVRTR